MTMTRSENRVSLVEEVAGGPVKGSWWGHAKGGLIFEIANAFHDSRQVISLRLVDGKVTFVHKSLWPALARMVLDPDWRRKAGARLRPDAGELFRVVERRGSIRMDQSGYKGRKELEPTLLVHSGTMHTEKGSHTTVLTRWADVFDAKTVEKSRGLSFDEARRKLGLTYAAPPSQSSTGLPSESRT